MIICKYVVIFFFYSMLGFIYESIYSSINKHHWQNRGFFYGPIIPIYGVGACVGTLLFYDLHIPFLENANVLVIFLVGYLGSIVLEYTTSYVLEKIFHAVWWDYSNKFLNIHGRVCLSASIGFGVAAIVIVKWLIPWVEKVVSYFPDALMVSLSLIFIFLLGIDFALTISALSNFQRNFNRIEREYTEKMTQLYDNIESSVVAKKDGITNAAGSFIEKHETLQGAVNTLNGAKQGIINSKEKIVTKTENLTAKQKMHIEEQEKLIEQEVNSIMESTSEIEKEALSRISEFKTEGKKKKITNSIKEKLRRN